MKKQELGTDFLDGQEERNWTWNILHALGYFNQSALRRVIVCKIFQETKEIRSALLRTEVLLFWGNPVPWKIFLSFLELVVLPQDNLLELIFPPQAVGRSARDRGGPCSLTAILGMNLGIPSFHHMAAFRGEGVKPHF